jgi:hypothetical protein
VREVLGRRPVEDGEELDEEEEDSGEESDEENDPTVPGKAAVGTSNPYAALLEDSD